MSDKLFKFMIAILTVFLAVLFIVYWVVRPEKIIDTGSAQKAQVLVQQGSFLAGLL